jgi:glucose-1-phosphate thymidylyltransferase
VLRSPFFLRAPGFSGAIASLETLGVAVISSEDGRARLERGEFDGRFVWGVLHAVNPPRADAFVRSLPAPPAQPPAPLAADAQTGVGPADVVALIALGGYGTRAGETPKALQPIYDKPLFYYLLSQAIIAGARRIVIATTPEVRPFIERALGRGGSLGVELHVIEVTDPRGPADLFRRQEIAALISGRRVMMILDGVYIGASWRPVLRRLVSRSAGCVLLGRNVEDPRPFGYLHMDRHARVAKLSEKRTDIIPQNGQMHPVVTHISVFDATVLARALALMPAASGEFQLPDLQGSYAADGDCEVVFEDAGFWSDGGTPELLLRLSNLVASVQDDGQPVGSPHWEAYEQGFISADQLQEYATRLPEKSPYRALLLAALVRKEPRRL